MKTFLSLALAMAIAGAFLLPSNLSAQIINIDYLGTRTDGPTPESTPNGATGYPSVFAAGGSSAYYNDIVADDTADTDNLTVSGLNLIDSNSGLPTTIGFTISPVGADNNGIGVFNGSDLFLNSANNHALTAAFTISGLGTATAFDIAFLTDFSGNTPALTFDGVAATPIKVNYYTYQVNNIPIIGGTVTGTIGGSNTGTYFIISGLGIEAYAVPEPSTWLLIVLGSLFIVPVLRRRGLSSL